MRDIIDTHQTSFDAHVAVYLTAVLLTESAVKGGRVNWGKVPVKLFEADLGRNDVQVGSGRLDASCTEALVVHQGTCAGQVQRSLVSALARSVCCLDQLSPRSATHIHVNFSDQSLLVEVSRRDDRCHLSYRRTTFPNSAIE